MTTHTDDDMPAEIDFSNGTRGKFYNKDTQVSLPVYLDKQVQTTLAAMADAKGLDISVLVNAMLKKDIELIQLAH